MDDQPNFVTSPFDVIRHQDREHDFWRARELHKLLGYDRWEIFEKVIAKAKVACWMSSEELADNIFRAAQTDATMRREHTRGKEQANSTHFAVGRKVREFIINELGNTPPEDLPTPRRSIKHLQIEEEKRLKQEPQLSLFEDEQKDTRDE